VEKALLINQPPIGKGIRGSKFSTYTSLRSSNYFTRYNTPVLDNQGPGKCTLCPKQNSTEIPAPHELTFKERAKVFFMHGQA
jgi:hypothetical protein